MAAFYPLFGILGTTILVLLAVIAAGFFIRKRDVAAAIPAIDLAQKALSIYEAAEKAEAKQREGLIEQNRLCAEEKAALQKAIAVGDERIRKLEQTTADHAIEKMSWASERATWQADKARLERRIDDLELQVRSLKAQIPPLP